MHPSIASPRSLFVSGQVSRTTDLLGLDRPSSLPSRPAIHPFSPRLSVRLSTCIALLMYGDVLEYGGQEALVSVAISVF